MEKCDVYVVDEKREEIYQVARIEGELDMSNIVTDTDYTTPLFVDLKCECEYDTKWLPISTNTTVHWPPKPRLYAYIDKVEVFPKIDNPRAVEITMENGDKFRAECCKGDKFDLETGISICITKAIIGNLIGKESSTREYNRLIRQALKTYEQGIKDKSAAEEEKRRIENRKKKAALKKQRRKERKQKEQAEIFANAWSMFSEKIARDMMNEYMTEEPNEEN